MRKRTRDEEPQAMTQDQIAREIEKRFAKTVEDKHDCEDKQTSEEIIQAGVDRMLAAHSAQGTLKSEPSDQEDAYDGGEDPPSRGSGVQRGRGHTLSL